MFLPFKNSSGNRPLLKLCHSWPPRGRSMSLASSKIVIPKLWEKNVCLAAVLLIKTIRQFHRILLKKQIAITVFLSFRTIRFNLISDSLWCELFNTHFCGNIDIIYTYLHCTDLFHNLLDTKGFRRKIHTHVCETDYLFWIKPRLVIFGLLLRISHCQFTADELFLISSIS